MEDLVRVTRSEQGLAIGRDAPGRGAWVCAGSSRCIERVVRRDTLARALRHGVGAEELEDLRIRLLDQAPPQEGGVGVCEDGVSARPAGSGRDEQGS